MPDKTTTREKTADEKNKTGGDKDKAGQKSPMGSKKDMEKKDAEKSTTKAKGKQDDTRRSK